MVVTPPPPQWPGPGRWQPVAPSWAGPGTGGRGPLNLQHNSVSGIMGDEIISEVFVWPLIKCHDVGCLKSDEIDRWRSSALDKARMENHMDRCILWLLELLSEPKIFKFNLMINLQT